MTRAVFVVVVGLTTTVPVVAQAQGPAPETHAFTVSGGASWLGGYPIGANSATLRRNEPGTTAPSPFTLFNADLSIERAWGADARLAYAVTEAFELELGGAYSRPAVAISIAQDPESTAVVLSGEKLYQFVVDGSVVWHLSRLALAGRTRPYLTAGAGRLWQLDGDRVQVETGTVAHVGGGVRYWLRGGDGIRRALGVRGEVRLQMRSGGVEIESKTRLFPAVHLLGFFGF
jgi:hypothetical protein